jgi:diaminopimelate epimerase
MQSSPIPFEKMSGTGNDFVIIDNRSLRISLAEQFDLERKVARRTFSCKGPPGWLLLGI